MEIKEAMRSVLQEMILPEFNEMKQEQAIMAERFNAIDERFNTIDERFNAIDERFNAIDERFKSINERLNAIDKRLDDTNRHLVDQSRRIDAVRGELMVMIQKANERLDRLFEVVVRKEEHFKLEQEFRDLRIRVENLERQVAA